MSKQKVFNKMIVGTYIAICQAPNCGVLLPVPVLAYQVGARRAADSKLFTEPDLTDAWEHYMTVHPNEASLQPSEDIEYAEIVEDDEGIIET